VRKRASGRRTWGRIDTLYSAIQKRVLSRNLHQNMPKMRIVFWKKSYKIAVASGALNHHWPPLCYSGLILTTCSCAFLTINAFYYFRKRTKVTTANNLPSILYSAFFVGKGAKFFFCQHAQRILATPLDCTIKKITNNILYVHFIPITASGVTRGLSQEGGELGWGAHKPSL